MKIEMGESLLYSYLRQVKGCLLTQLNWKPSGNWNVAESRKDYVQSLFSKIEEHPVFSNIFKIKLVQSLKQGEIDVLGVDANNNVYAVDVAFHEYGLQYGDKIETRDRVIKKMLRTYLTLKFYFPERRHTIIFCSPKVNPATETEIQEYFKILVADFSDENTVFQYYSNGEFKAEILDPSFEYLKSESDTSELFARAIKLFTLLKPSVKESLVVTSNSRLNGDAANGREVREINQEEQVRVEIAKIESRIPKWFNNPGQINSRILIRFVELMNDEGKVVRSALENRCKDIIRFDGNYNQMKNFGDKNHGKVFEEVDGVIELWEPVEEFVLAEYEETN